MKKIIHVNQSVIKRNRDKGLNDPPLICRTYKGSCPAHEIDILDKLGNVVARIVHSPHKPLSCGARVWIETYEGVTVRLDSSESHAQGDSEIISCQNSD